MSIMRLIVPATSKMQSLTYWLTTQVPGLSFSLAGRLLRKGAITVNGEALYKDKYELVGGEIIEIDRSRFSLLEPVPMEFDVLYEDDDVIVINKSAPLVVHPSLGHPRYTVINGLVARYSFIEPLAQGWPRIVHRLDRDTSGVLIVARSLAAHRFLQKQFRERTTKKEYLALVFGHPKTAYGTIKGPIGSYQSKSGWRKWAIRRYGSPSTTHYKLLECFTHHSFLLVRPITGRTHQIRVHLNAIALPITNDPRYGPRNRRHHIPQLKRHFLHAARLTITTPDGQRRTFEAPLPEALQVVLRDLSAQSEFANKPWPAAPTHKIYPFYQPAAPTELKTQKAPSPVLPIEPIEPIKEGPPLIELLASLDDVEGFEPIDLTLEFDGFDEFRERFDEFDEFDDLDDLDDLDELDGLDELDDLDEFM